MLSEADFSVHSVQYAVLNAFLDREGPCRDQSQPCLKHFGASLASLAVTAEGKYSRI